MRLIFLILLGREKNTAGKVSSYFLMYETFMSDLVAQVLWEVGNVKGK